MFSLYPERKSIVKAGPKTRGQKNAVVLLV